MREEEFQQLIDRRLEENRKVLDTSPMPEWLKPAAAYLGFHAFRVLFVASLGVVLLLYGVFYDELMLLSKMIFGRQL